jgi:hypothetical protein
MTPRPKHAARPAAVETLEPRRLLAVHTTSWVGNTLPGATQEFVQQDVKELVLSAAGRVFAVTPYDEGHSEVGVYEDGVKHGRLHQTHYRVGAAAMTFDDANWLFLSWKQDTNNDGSDEYFVRRFRNNPGDPLREFHGLNYSNADGYNDIFVSAANPVTGLAWKGDRVYAAVEQENRVYKFRDWDKGADGSFAVDPNPGKMRFDSQGNLWILHQLDDKVVKYDANGNKLLTISDLDEPTSIGIDHKDGRILIGDSGPGRDHVRIYQLDGTPDGIYGSSILSGTPGQVTPTKFDHVMGAERDTDGNWYVAWNGGPDRSYGGREYSDGQGAVIRSTTDAGAENWSMLGLHFIDTLAPDPMDDSILFGKTERFVMDYTKPAGQQWTWAAHTLDRHNYPNDPRLKQNHTSTAWVRRLGPNNDLFMATTDQYNDYYTIYRFNGEIAIPAVMFSWKSTYFAGNGTSGTNNWMWRDANGDGQFQAGEFTDLPSGNAGAGTATWYIDDAGTAWSTRMFSLAMTGVDANGVPIYNSASPATYTRPAEFNRVNRLQYDPATDVMYVVGYTPTYPRIGSDPRPLGTVVARYDNWSGTRTLRSLVPLPYDQSYLGGGKSFAFEGDYTFVTPVDPPHVDIFDMRTGVKVHTLTPGPEVDSVSGWIDTYHALHAHKRPNGEYVVYAEEDFYAKVVQYRWHPEGGSDVWTDSFLDSGRTNGADISDIPWARIAASTLTVDSAGTQMRGKTLKIDATGTNGGAYGVFSTSTGAATGTRLGTTVGDRLELSMHVGFLSASGTGQLRVGLYNNNGSNSTADGSSSYNNDYGYRFDLARAGGTGSLRRETGSNGTIGAGSDTVDLGGVAGASAPALGIGRHVLTLTLERTSTGVQVVAALDGKTLRTATDTTGKYEYFHGAFIGIFGSSSDDLRIDDVSLRSVTAPAAPVTATRYQAESATLAGGTFAESSHAGAEGSYINFPTSGGTATWSNVNVAAAGQYTLTFRYANGGTSARNAGLSVNGSAISGGVTFAATGSWSIWSTVSLTVSLLAGDNALLLSSTGQDAGNVDWLEVASG